MTICNLFVNHAYTISDIVRALDEDRTTVVLALLEQGIIRERRTKQIATPDGTERRKSAPGAKAMGWANLDSFSSGRFSLSAIRRPRPSLEDRKPGCTLGKRVRNQFPICFAKVVQSLLNCHRFQSDQFNRLVLPHVQPSFFGFRFPPQKATPDHRDIVAMSTT